VFALWWFGEDATGASRVWFGCKRAVAIFSPALFFNRIGVMLLDWQI
jgi:hypothetical protein